LGEQRSPTKYLGEPHSPINYTTASDNTKGQTYAADNPKYDALISLVYVVRTASKPTTSKASTHDMVLFTI